MSHVCITHFSCERNKSTSDAAHHLDAHFGPNTHIQEACACQVARGLYVPVFLRFTISLYRGNSFDGGELPCELPPVLLAGTWQYMECSWLGFMMGLVVP